MKIRLFVFLILTLLATSLVMPISIGAEPTVSDDEILICSEDFENVDEAAINDYENTTDHSWYNNEQYKKTGAIRSWWVQLKAGANEQGKGLAINRSQESWRHFAYVVGAEKDDGTLEGRTAGVYTLTFDLKPGDSTFELAASRSANYNIDGTTGNQYTYLFKTTAGELTATAWYDVEVIMNLDEGKYSYKITDANGNTAKSGDGNYTNGADSENGIAAKLSAFAFARTLASGKNDETSFVVDNLVFSMDARFELKDSTFKITKANGEVNTTLTDVSPAIGAIQLDFGTQMLQSTVNETTVRLMKGSSEVQANRSWDGNAYKMTVSKLDENSNYRVVVADGIKTQDGRTVVAREYSFTTKEAKIEIDDADFEIYEAMEDTWSSVSGDKIIGNKVKVVVKGLNPQQKKLFAGIAAYDEFGRLLLTKTETSYNTMIDFEIIIDEKTADMKTIKSFIWEADTFTPLKMAKAYDVETVRGEVNVMSFNVLCQLWNNASTSASRIDGNFAQVATYKPDVVGMQELCADTYAAWENKIASENSSYKFLEQKTVLVGGTTQTNLTNIMYNSDTVEVLASGATPYESRDADLCRVMTWGKFKVKATADTFILVNTHWNNGDDVEKRGPQATELAEFIEDLKTAHGTSNVIVTGDFNTNKASASYSSFLTQSGLTEASDDAEKKGLLTKTYHAYNSSTYPSKPAAEYVKAITDETAFAGAIDHIAYKSNGAKTKYFTVISNEAVWNSSDHLPIFATFDLGDRSLPSEPEVPSEPESTTTVNAQDLAWGNYGIADATGKLNSKTTRVATESFIKVNAGDRIYIEQNDTNYGFIMYGYKTPSLGGYSANHYIIDDTAIKWANDFEFTEGLKYVNGDAVNYPLYVRLVIRDIDNSNANLDVDSIKNTFKFEIATEQPKVDAYTLKWIVAGMSDDTGTTTSAKHRATTEDFVKVDKGDCIWVENLSDTNYQLIAYAYKTPSVAGYSKNQYIRATDTNTWGGRIDFTEGLKYANGSEVSYPVYVRVFVRNADSDTGNIDSDIVKTLNRFDSVNTTQQ